MILPTIISNWSCHIFIQIKAYNHTKVIVQLHYYIGLRICRFGYQFFKPVCRYPLGLELNPHSYPRAQTQTRIRARRIWYPRVCGCFIPVAIFIRNAQILRLNIMPVTLVVRMGASPVGSSLWWDCYPPEFDPWDRTWVPHRGGYCSFEQLLPNNAQSPLGCFPSACLSRVEP